jgi:predicted nucleic acid-binding protein
VINFKNLFVVLPDEAGIFLQWEGLVIKYNVSGKQAHDTRLVAAMLVHGLTHLLTFNDRNFKRYDEIAVVNPQNVS